MLCDKTKMANLKTSRSSVFAFNYETYSDCLVYVDYTVYCPLNKRYKKYGVSFYDEDLNFLDDSINDYIYRQFQAFSELCRCKLKDYKITVSAIKNSGLCGYHCDSLNSALTRFVKDLMEVRTRA